MMELELKNRQISTLIDEKTLLAADFHQKLEHERDENDSKAKELSTKIEQLIQEGRS